MARLTACLALVRPVGFTDDNASDWLRVAAVEVAYIPLATLDAACAHARRVADHHAKIVPAIVKFADEAIEAAHKAREQQSYWAPEPRRERLAGPGPWRPTREELDALHAKATADLRAGT